jgi:ubiquinone/menaquinone biosynthesis C-methylase UbiE
VTAFDQLAAVYDDLWTGTTIGQLQRKAVWRHAAPAFARGDKVLELGCGTGEDALWLRRLGVQVTATDSSPAMVRMARLRGLDASVFRIEDAHQLDGPFDAVFSNFGAFNCVESVGDLCEPLARLIRPGGCLVLCVIGRFCLWETCWYLLHGRFRKAVRRWSGQASSSLGVNIRYPRCSAIQAALTPAFALSETFGIGALVPPSYVSGISTAVLESLARMENKIAGRRGVRALADHRLLIFRRL